MMWTCEHCGQPWAAASDPLTPPAHCPNCKGAPDRCRGVEPWPWFRCPRCRFSNHDKVPEPMPGPTWRDGPPPTTGPCWLRVRHPRIPTAYAEWLGIWTTQGVLWTGESNVGQQPIPIERILAHAPVPMPREVKP